MHISLDQAIGRQPRLNRVGQSILNIGGGAGASYSLRSLTGDEPKAVRIRRDGDNEERDFTTAEIVNEAADWTNGKQETTLPADVATSAAAYSLRKVKSDYTGDVVKVRRESDNAEKGFTASEISSGALVDFVNADGTQFMNFDGTDDDITTPALLPATDDFTLTITAFIESTPSSSMGIFGSAASGTGRHGLQLNTDGAVQFFAENLGGAAITTATIIEKSINTIVLTRTGQTFEISLNGGGAASRTGSSVVLTTGNNNIGDPYAGVNFQGVITSLSVASTTWDGTIANVPAGSTVNGSPSTNALNDGFVTIWYDQSGNSKNATQDVAANQPLIVENGSLLTDSNNQPIIDFLDDSVTGFNISNSISPDSIFAVVDITDMSGTQRIFERGGNNGILIASNQASFRFNNTTSRLVSSATGKQLLTGIDGSSGLTAKNGTEVTTSGITTSFFSGSDYKIGVLYFSGTTQAYKGHMYELIIYDSDQTNNRFKIESNIFNHYGILDGTSLSSSTAFFLDGTAGSPSSFTADGLDGFTIIIGGQGNVRAGIELQNKVPSGKHLVVSFDADLTLGTGTATPIIKLMRTSLSGLGGGPQIEIIQGRNTISLNSNNNDSKFVLFVEGNTNVGYSISNFTMSLRDENGFVNKWYDQSGNSNDATAAADANEPKIVSAGSYLGELEFDGSNDVLEFTTAEVAASDKISVFMTLTGPSSGDKSLLGSSIAFPIRRFSGSNKLASLTNAGLHRLDSTSNFTDTNTGIITLIRDLAVPSGLLAVDGTVEDTVSTSYGLSSTYQIGAKLSGSSNGRFADIKCKELIVYATNQTTNRTAIETNIANEYGITLS